MGGCTLLVAMATLSVLMVLSQSRSTTPAADAPSRPPVEWIEEAEEETEEEQPFVDLLMDQWHNHSLSNKVTLTDKQAAWFSSLGSYGVHPQREEDGDPTYGPPTDPTYGPPTDPTTEHPAPDVPSHPDPALPGRRTKRHAGPRCYNIPGPMRVRKEYRQMTNAERTNFQYAVKELADYVPDNDEPNTSGYDIFVMYHNPSDAPSAHQGAGFLPWHREFLFRFENALIQQGYLYGLPYWDSSLDQTLPDPSASAIWTNDYLGNPTGVVEAPFADQTGFSAIPECTDIGPILARNIITGSAGQNYCFPGDDIDFVLQQSCFRELVKPISTRFEGAHNKVHRFVGGFGNPVPDGHMASTRCSPTDPVFWLHHAFVDCVWEEFRQGSQVSDPAKEYPSYSGNGDNIGGVHHEWYNPMDPFDGVVNAHGISQHYTDYYYRCAPRPTTCASNAACGSSILWCDMVSCRCRAKVRQGGDCTGLPNHACAGPCPPLGQIPSCDATTNTCVCVYVSIPSTGFSGSS